MTCIVGFTKNNHVWIAGDSQGSTRYNKTIREDPKVFKRGEFIMGFTSSFRMGQLLAWDNRFAVKPQSPNENDYAYLINEFIPAVQKLFTDGGYIKKTNEELEGGTFLLGYRGNLYKIDSDFQVGLSALNYDACGAGEDFALGAFHAMSITKYSPEKQIILALEAAEMHSTTVQRPFRFVKQ